MKKSLKTILTTLSFIIFFLILAYISPYLYYTRINNDDSYFYASNGEKIWAFGILTQSMHLYNDPESSKYKREMELRKRYLPLIKIDQYLFKNYHILDEDRPILKGE